MDASTPNDTGSAGTGNLVLLGGASGFQAPVGFWGLAHRQLLCDAQTQQAIIDLAAQNTSGHARGREELGSPRLSAR